METLILVDIQNDFLPGGSLAVPDGDAVVPVANRLIPKYEFVVATQDWHPANHGSFASQHDGVNVGDVFELNGLTQIAWPDHCVQGTVGAEFASSLRAESIHATIQKGTHCAVDSYSGFFDNGKKKATGLGELLSEKGVSSVDIVGLATDFCVKFTALDAIGLGLKTRLIVEGCRGVNLQAGDVQKAIAEMKSAGVEIVG